MYQLYLKTTFLVFGWKVWQTPFDRDEWVLANRILPLNKSKDLAHGYVFRIFNGFPSLMELIFGVQKTENAFLAFCLFFIEKYPSEMMYLYL